MNSLISHIKKPINKLTGGVEQLSLNGGMVIDVANLNNKTLYTSPYMVITDQEYTKHYYAGSERIASKLGGGFELAQLNPADDNHNLAPITSYTSLPEFYDQKKEDLKQLLGHSWDCLNMHGNVAIENEQLQSLEELQSANNPEQESYFYHTNHLGSSSWITDASGEAYQHLQNLPYGEQFIEQRQSSWGAVYQFTGYEKDQETGFDYAHARYYSSELSIFLSVDSMSDKYPSMSAYMYVAGNPVMLVDPDGRKIKPTNKEGKELFNKLIDKFGREMFHLKSKDETNFFEIEDKWRLKDFKKELKKSGYEKGSNEYKDAINLFKMIKSDNFLKKGDLSGEEWGFFKHSNNTQLKGIIIINPRFHEYSSVYIFHDELKQLVKALNSVNSEYHEKN